MAVKEQSCCNKRKKLFIEEALNKENFSRHPLPNDASLRKYERIISSDGNFVLMDASLDKGSIKSFVSVAEFLCKKGYSAPKIFAKEEELGLLLLEDLGETSYASLLGTTNKEIERKLYKKAIDLLVDIHLNEHVHEIEIPSYKKELLLDESILLVDWYFPILTGHKISEELRKEYVQAWKKIFECIHYLDDCLVLRDYHVDNLIWLDDRCGVKKIGVLDFQDAVKGSYSYDVVSLLEDARRDVDAEIAQEMLEYYIKQIKKIDQKKFLSDYKILGVQRSCKIVGIFAQKAARDKDSRYLKHLPRVWKYIKKNIDHPILEPLKNWFQRVDIPVMKN
jgi:N-acetylmuramate 1-kinase